MQLTYAQVPEWLKDSDFYRNLDQDDSDSHFDLPSDCFRETCAPIQTADDVIDIIRVGRFWGLTNIPLDILEYCYSNDPRHWIQECLERIGGIWSELEAIVLAFKVPHQFTLCKALSTTRSEFVDFWLSKNLVSNEENKHAIAQACRFGRLDLVKILRERDFPWDHLAYCAAAQYGHVYTLQCLFRNGCVGNRTAMQFAARGGQLECMKFLHSIGCPWFEDVTLEFAVVPHFTLLLGQQVIWTDDFAVAPPPTGYIDCLRYALLNGCPIHANACRRAAQYGLLDCLQLLHQHNAPWNSDTTTAAATAGHLDCLLYLGEHKCPISYRATAGAAANGHLACVQYTYGFADRYSVGACCVPAAAKAGHLDILQFFQKEKLLWNPAAIALAAREGYLDCVMLLHQNGCALDTQACKFACEKGQLECLKYLHKNGCPWNFESPARAANGNHLQCLQYLHEHGCSWCEATPAAAAENSHIECLRYVIENGCPYNEVITLTAAAGAASLECLKYLMEERACAVIQDVAICGKALVNARVTHLQYLLEKGFPISDFVYVKKRFCSDHTYSDEDLLKCIECAIQHGWKFNETFHNMVTNCNLPLSLGYLDSNPQVSVIIVKMCYLLDF